MDNEGHMVMMPDGQLISWVMLKSHAESMNATNANSSFFQRVTSKEKIQ